ncbi:MAG: gamma carbonic anhydrase family protein [Pseudomonadota bacterium]
MNIRPFEGVMPVIDPSVFVDETAIVIGNVEIGAESSLWPYVVVRGDVNSITIGARTNIQEASVLHCNADSIIAPGGTPLAIGSDVTVGHRAILHGCTVHDNVLVGMGATVMDKVVVEPEVVIAAGALVSPGKVLESGYLYAGAPAKRVRELNDTDRAWLDWTFGHYSELKERHLASYAAQ